MTAVAGDLFLSTGNETLSGTVAGLPLHCRVRLSVGLGALACVGTVPALRSPVGAHEQGV